MPRLISLVWNTSRIALTRSSLFARISTFSPDHAIDAPTFLKSKRCEISLAVWFSALSTSWWSTLLTMSNEESAITGHVIRAHLRRRTAPQQVCGPCMSAD